MKRYRGNMLLIELVLALLFFSLSMMVILQAFASAQLKSNDSGVLSDALRHARDVAEQLSREDDPETLLMRLGFSDADGTYVCKDAESYELRASVTREERTAGQLIRCTLLALGKNEMLFELPVAHYIPKEAAP